MGESSEPGESVVCLHKLRIEKQEAVLSNPCVGVGSMNLETEKPLTQ
jgi:hypothetical protein